MRSRRAGGRAALAVSLSLVWTVALACGKPEERSDEKSGEKSGEKPKAPPPPKLKKVVVGASPVLTTAGIFIALEEGYFREQGLDVEIVDFKDSGSPQIPLLASGKLNVGAGNMNAGLLNAVASDVDIRVVADKGTVYPGLPFLSLLVREDLVDSGKVKGLADLKGKRMAVTAPGVSQEIQTEAALARGGLKLSDVELVHMAYKDMNVAFASGQLDAAIQIEPFISKALSDGIAVKLIGGDELTPGLTTGVLFYSMRWADGDPEAANGFFIAYVKALRQFNDAFLYGVGKDRVIEILTKHTPVKTAATYELMTPAGLHPDGTPSWDKLAETARWLHAHGYVTKELPPESFLERRYCEHAMKVLGPYKPPINAKPTKWATAIILQPATSPQ